MSTNIVNASVTHRNDKDIYRFQKKGEEGTYTCSVDNKNNRQCVKDIQTLASSKAYTVSLSEDEFQEVKNQSFWNSVKNAVENAWDRLMHI